MNEKTLLAQANELFQLGNLREAIKQYELAKSENPRLATIVDYNIELAKSKLKNKKKKAETSQDKLLMNVSKSRKKILTALHNSINNKELAVKILEISINKKEDFHTGVYLTLYPDIQHAIAEEEFTSAEQHYQMFGKGENRIHSYHSFIAKLKSEVTGIKETFNNVNQLFNEEYWPTPLHEVERSYDLTSVPFYLENSSHIDIATSITDMRIGVHLHLYYVEMLDTIAEYLANIPIPFDLYISSPHLINHDETKSLLIDRVQNVKFIEIRSVPNRGRDLAPFIIEYGDILQDYDAICHIHTKKSDHTKELASWGDNIFRSLLGSQDHVKKILTLLKNDAKIVYPNDQNHYIKDPTGWAENHEIAKILLDNYLDIDISHFPRTVFPEGSMFWARKEGINSFLEMPLEWEDFPEEPIPTDGTLAHALERIIFISSCSVPGKIVKIIEKNNSHDKLYYEEKKSYLNKIKEESIKILSFYLPQFHPIPENDEWHGEGFTEWTKVTASTPLFKNHYQQHIPHEDIGYYLLDSPKILKKQAALMSDAGVYGQIFYHYWFSGKLILEEPVKILLENNDIDMPFCFCWANENWTKRWDGNDNEVLLSQNYSREDAKGFIDYLVPFLKDDRYIKIDGRPVLYIYRPSSIPDPAEYIEIWNTVCAEHGIPPLYITAILTRGAHDPRDYGMDGALERVLHDWTDGNAPEIKQNLHHYWPVNGSVLNYSDVADYYSKQTDSKNFNYYRSLVPTWDNTARYGSEAFIVHDSTPEKFQTWLEHSIEYTKANLPEDRHLIVVNAWNEWAEGAHLEPDTQFGYAYLNSVGRALSRIKYADDKINLDLKSKKTIEIEIPEYLTNSLELDKYLSFKFFQHLADAIKISKQTVYIRNARALELLKAFKCNLKNSATTTDCKIQFRKVALIQDNFITELLKTHLSFKDSVIISNDYGMNHNLQSFYGHDAVSSESAYNNSVLLIPNNRLSDTYKISHKARAFSTQICTTPIENTPQITTIIRLHKNDNFSELKNALMSLSAVHSCIVKPTICAQDLTPHQLKELARICEKFYYTGFNEIQINKFSSKNKSGDIRAKLLHEGIKTAKTRYLAFLDHDDLMMADSYAYLINRLNITGKAASFGRVYDTSYESGNEKFLKRNKTYEYGTSHEEFLEVNHAPLHSFLVDLSQIDIASIHYFEDQKFMEDYYLTLQIFNKQNTDWASLYENFYIGDYIHCTDRLHTLAITDTNERESVIVNAEFEKCKNRIQDLKMKIKQPQFNS